MNFFKSISLFALCLSACAEKDDSNSLPTRPFSKEEAQPDFVDLPHFEVAPLPGSNSTNSGSSGLTFTPGQGQLDLDPQAKCETYAERFWKVGAETIEEAPGPLSTKITFTTTVLSRNGTQATVRAVLKTPDSSQNIDEQITFDVCKEPSKVAIINTMQNCSITDMGDDTLVVRGQSYKTKKLRIGPCSDPAGKTYDTLVWRANEIPLWGVLKREVRGTIVPSLLNGLIGAQTTSWSLGR